MKIEPVELEGEAVRLEPLAERHLEGLVRAGGPEEIWRWMPMRIADLEGARGWLRIAETWLASQQGLVFATLDRGTGEVVGSTGFLAASPPNRRVEIGATWITPAHQRSPVNTEAKFLMLRHAFEGWSCLRVEFKTDARNERSRNALLRIGATAEGVHRAHMVMPDGRVRDSAWFSVIASEWPAVKAGLEARMARAAPAPC